MSRNSFPCGHPPSAFSFCPECRVIERAIFRELESGQVVLVPRLPPRRLSFCLPKGFHPKHIPTWKAAK